MGTVADLPAAERRALPKLKRRPIVVSADGMERPVWHAEHAVAAAGRAREPDAEWGIRHCAVQHCRYADRGWDGPTPSGHPPFLDVSSLNSAAPHGVAFLLPPPGVAQRTLLLRLARSGQP